MILHRTGYTHAQAKDIIDTLLGNCHTGIRVELYDRSGAMLRDITGFFTTGQVDVDEQGHRGQMTLYDPKHSIDLTDDAMYLRRQVKVHQRVYTDSQGWCEWPIAMGPLVAADPQADGTININWVGKAMLAARSMRHPHTLKKGSLVTDCINTALVTWAGMRQSDIVLPSLPARLSKDIHTRLGQTPWQVAHRLADMIGHVLSFEADGHTLLRKIPTTPVYTFYDHHQAVLHNRMASVLSVPVRSQTLTGPGGRPLANWVQVHGYKPPKGKHKPPVFAEAFADPRSPISKEKLAVGGVDFTVLKSIDAPHIRETKTAQDRADHEVAKITAQAVDVTAMVQCLPVFDRLDCTEVHTKGLHQVINLARYSYTIGDTQGQDNQMSIGRTQQLSMAGARRR